MKLLPLIALLAAFALPSRAAIGVDVSTSVSEGDWQCMVKNGVQFAVVRGYRSDGTTDPAAPATVAAAHAGGVQNVDIYLFPCYHCGDGAGQMGDLVDYLRDNNVQFGQIWLDVEAPNLWSDSCSSNVAFIQAMAKAGQDRGITVGIYTSESQWKPIACDSTELSGHQLWYAHYDNNPSFSDFTPFGGWSQPAIKQYKGTTSLCGAGVDMDYY